MENTEENIITNIEPLKELKRIDGHYISHEIKHLLHLESGFIFTVKQLFIRPGKLVRTFISEDRSKATKPVVFLILSATIFTVIFHFFHMEWQFFGLDQTTENTAQYSTKKAINNWTSSHIGYTSLAIGFLIAFWIRVFFRKHGYNIYEITVLLCYSIGQLLLIIAIFYFPVGVFLLKNNIIREIGVYIGFFYVFWSVGQFFGEKKIINYIKSTICCFLGALSFRLILNLLVIIYYQLGIK
ncbi:uncharacterized protein DUF3667 [Arcicella aurantiaca]|uniref:Uncharacterized protein DUF3667 n=1 Tax=Arcicella aurantiaca TaxID=591202 RepID=A0A316DZ11_9BACT|nr:DUF3667 domain-containing protein [Arcicella aurantiaca]PWK15740.1 uncharacterized protein DUF3667 [Arcicella aurantiaca]